MAMSRPHPASEAPAVAPLDPAVYRDLVRRALDEDVGAGDITTDATVAAHARAHGIFLAKAGCVVAGLDVAFECFRQVAADPHDVDITIYRHDGEWCEASATIARISASARTLLVGERTALNFLQRLSGIATTARRFVNEASGRLIVLDTRKTTPTLRALEKYAVRAGGATNHRVGLYDGVLIKDNHIRLAGGVSAAVAAMREHRPDTGIEVEAQTLADVDEAVAAGADIVLVDNMTTPDICEAVRKARGRDKTVKVEISGGVTLERMRELAATGADFVSVGALTHSAPAIDISFEIEPD